MGTKCPENQPSQSAAHMHPRELGRNTELRSLPDLHDQNLESAFHGDPLMILNTFTLEKPR